MRLHAIFVFSVLFGLSFASIASTQARRTRIYRDPASGLVMQFGFSPDSQSQEESIAYCARLRLAGRGWRLPTKDELLIVYANRAALESTAEFFWSSSSVAGSPSYGWGVNGWAVEFSSGLAYNSFGVDNGRARCVRSGAPSSLPAAPSLPSTPPPTGPDTVRDNVFGLVMQFGFSPDSQSQAESIAYCASLPLAGGGWRLPTKDELDIVYANRRALESAARDDGFWSSSSVAGWPSTGWVVSLYNGSAGSGGVASSYRARCVR